VPAQLRNVLDEIVQGQEGVNQLPHAFGNVFFLGCFKSGALHDDVFIIMKV